LSPPTNPSIKSKFAQLQLRTPASVSRTLRCCNQVLLLSSSSCFASLVFSRIVYNCTAHTIREVHHLLSLPFILPSKL
jgi:hypothetical protein